MSKVSELDKDQKSERSHHVIRCDGQGMPNLLTGLPLDYSAYQDYATRYRSERVYRRCYAIQMRASND